MALTLARFCSMLFAVLALAPGMAHLFALPNKIGMARNDYLTVQRIYRGWSLLGIVVIAALLSTLILTIMVRHRPTEFVLSLVAFLCIAGTQALFWTFTYPANRQTVNWTTLPENWARLRTQWEYSHAASAVLNLIAVIALICVLLFKEE